MLYMYNIYRRCFDGARGKQRDPIATRLDAALAYYSIKFEYSNFVT